MIAPHLEEMDKTMDDVVFLKVDVDECEDISEEYKVGFKYLPISLQLFQGDRHANFHLSEEQGKGNELSKH